MKYFHYIIVISALFLSGLLHSQTVKSEVWVNGECEMCKERIEKTSLKKGAKSAIWNSEDKILSLEYDPQKVTLNSILEKIAEVGHDNEKYLTSEKTYSKLPGCCNYDRSLSKPNIQEIPNQLKNGTTQYFVKGNCSMCKTRIEKAAKEAGATSADWNSATQILHLNISENTSAEKILKAVADVGHDNERYNTTEAIYNALPECCLYDRNLAPGEKNPLIHSDENSMNETENGQAIDEIKLLKTQEAIVLSKKSADLTYNINKKELLKAACCNLSESFETNATVDVSFSNAVTGTKQLKMLGLDQKYTALTKELLPEIRGISSAYGLNFIPGRWIGGIQLTKGGSTVTNGYESITGQINTELLKFNKNPETQLNLFADFQGRTEFNLTQLSNLKEHWDHSILVHANGTFGMIDENHDGFTDRPKGNQLNLSYLLNYDDLSHTGLASHFGINMMKDNRKAGETMYDWQKPSVLQDKYGVGIDISRFQIWNKTGHIFKGKPYQSIGWMNQYTFHQQDSFFGWRNYFGKQNTFYSNLIFESIFGNTNHKYKTGASFLYDGFHENYLDEHYKRTETVPGIFFEYTLTGQNYTLVAGSRVDFHNLAGTQFTPRLNFKYDITPKTILRLSAGKGFRTANIFAENQQYFASNRKIEIIKSNGTIYDLKPEIAWNYGASLQQEFRLFNRKASLIADFFRTDFQNQVLADLDISPQKLVFYNLTGKSFANSFQTQVDFSPAKNLDLRIAYKFYDVQADFLSGEKQVPFMAKNRGFFNASYLLKKDGSDASWNFDTTLQYIGKQRIPSTKTNPIEFQLPEFSDAYIAWNSQISRDFNKNVRAYFGGENLLGYMQKNPILDAKNPFGNYFDGGLVYAPIMPANFYVGVDFKF